MIMACLPFECDFYYLLNEVSVAHMTTWGPLLCRTSNKWYFPIVTSRGSSVGLGLQFALEVEGSELRYHTGATGDLHGSTWARRD